MSSLSELGRMLNFDSNKPLRAKDLKWILWPELHRITSYE